MTTRQIHAAITDAARNGRNFCYRDPRTGHGIRITETRMDHGVRKVKTLGMGPWSPLPPNAEFYEA